MKKTARDDVLILQIQTVKAKDRREKKSRFGFVRKIFRTLFITQ